MSEKKLSELLRDKIDTVKGDYLRVVDMNKKGQASLMRVTYEQGLYDGLERAWREAVIREHDCLLDVRLPISEIDRLRNIEQKAIALLRELVDEDHCNYRVDRDVAKELAKAIGITVEELRGASSKS